MRKKKPNTSQNEKNDVNIERETLHFAGDSIKFIDSTTQIITVEREARK